VGNNYPGDVLATEAHSSVTAPDGPAQPSLRQLRRTLDEAAERWEHRRPADDAALDTMLWLRTARAHWLLGRIVDAQLWYGRAAEELLDVALGFGGSTGTYAYFAELALGAASLSERGSVLARVADVVRTHPEPHTSHRRRARGPRGAEPVLAAHFTLRAWAAWCMADTREAAISVVTAARQAAGLAALAEARWRQSHWPELLQAVEALVDGRGDALRRALLAMDVKLASSGTGAATASTGVPAVHETLVALTAEWKRRFPRSYDPSGLSPQVEPGAVSPALAVQADAAGIPGD
jgi:hypothetical protein